MALFSVSVICFDALVLDMTEYHLYSFLIFTFDGSLLKKRFVFNLDEIFHLL